MCNDAQSSRADAFNIEGARIQTLTLPEYVVRLSHLPCHITPSVILSSKYPTAVPPRCHGGVFAYIASPAMRNNDITNTKGSPCTYPTEGIAMDDHIVWSLRDTPVSTNFDAQLLLPHGNHRLLIKRALDLLSREVSVLSSTVHTIYNLPWPIKSIIEPNVGREPLWAVHTRLPSDIGKKGQQLSPFICANRDIRPSMTKSLTIHITGTLDNPVVTSVYPGEPLPPLPWTIDGNMNRTAYANSLEFWRRHSFLYDKTIAYRQQELAPDWFSDIPSPLPLLVR